MLLGWLEAFPPRFMLPGARALVQQAWGFLASGYEEPVDAAAALLEHAPAASARTEREWQGHIAAIRAYAAARSFSLGRARDMTQLALNLLPLDEWAVRSLTRLAQAHTAWAAGQPGEAVIALNEAEHLAMQAGYQPALVAIVTAIASAQAEAGHLEKAWHSYRQALLLAGDEGKSVGLGATAAIGLAWLHWQRNELDEAGIWFHEGWVRGKRVGHADAMAHGLAGQVQVRLSRNDIEGAEEALARLGALLAEDGVSVATESQLSTFWPRVWLANGSNALALRWLDERGLDLSESGWEPALEAEYIAAAEVLVAVGCDTNDSWVLDQAARLVNRLTDFYGGLGLTLRHVTCLALQSQILAHRRQIAAAAAKLADAFELIDAESCIRTFIEPADRMLPLLIDTYEAGIARDIVGRLLAALGADVPEITGPAPAWEHGNNGVRLSGPLSAREMTVLRLLAQGYSYQQMANELSLAVGTVKAHTSNVYSKLGVDNRAGAIDQARMLALI